MKVSNKKKNEEALHCPVARFLGDLERVCENSEFMNHLRQSRIEFLKAVRSIIDGKIEHLEKKVSSGVKKKMTKIKVE
jgi:hypothetical protein